MNSTPTPLGEAVMGGRGEEERGRKGDGGICPGTFNFQLDKLSTLNLTNFQLPTAFV
jgi:hypothetical protein